MIDRNELAIAEARADDLLTAWRWLRSLDYRVRLARLRAELVGIEPAEQDKLAGEVGDFKAVVAALDERATT